MCIYCFKAHVSGMLLLRRDQDAIRRMGMSLRDGSELLALPLRPIPACKHDEQHALKALLHHHHHHCEQQMQCA